MDDGGKFHPAAFDRAVGSIKPTKSGRGGGGGRGRGGKGERGGRGGRGAQQQAAADCLKLIRTIVAKGMEPLLVFAFGTPRLTYLLTYVRTYFRYVATYVERSRGRDP